MHYYCADWRNHMKFRLKYLFVESNKVTILCSSLFLLFYFGTVHSVLFPGGASDLFDSPYERTGKILFNLAVKANKAGDVFPLWGTCLGFEFLSICGAGGGNIISKVDGENYSVALNLSVGKWIYSFLIAPVAKIYLSKTYSSTLQEQNLFWDVLDYVS